MNDEWDYKVSGKNNSLVILILTLVASAFFTALTVDQLVGKGNKLTIVAIFFATIAISSIYIFLKVALRYFFFKVYIGKNGFYFQSNPFNGKYYEYADITSCKEELKSSRSEFISGPSQTSYFYFFIFTDKSGKTTKLQFDKALHGHEFDELKIRINDKIS